MDLLEATRPEFRRHDSFGPRYGWFRKALVATESDPYVFSSDDAPVQIGVGINMVRAVRTWGLAAKIIHESQARTTPKRATPTRFAYELLGERGWDRFVEDQSSLWLLHWRMLAPVCRIPVWWLAFNEFEDTEFSKDELEGAVTKKLTDADWHLPHPSTIRRDLETMLLTYTPSLASKERWSLSFQEFLESPLRSLRLIQHSETYGFYRFNPDPKLGLPSEIIAHACLDFARRSQSSSNSISVRRLAEEPGAPGRVFKIAESKLLPALRQQVRKRPDMRLTENNEGDHTLSWSGAPSHIAELILGALYANRPAAGEAWLAMPEAGSMLLPGSARSAPSSGETSPDGTLRARSLANQTLTTSQQGAPGQPDYQDLLRMLEDVCPLQPAVAARHSAEHDLVRVFSFNYALGGYPSTALAPSSEYDGKVLLMVGNQTDPPPLCQSTPAGKPTLAVIPDDLSSLLAPAGEVTRLASLAQPRNADITKRLTEARAALRSATEEAFSPRNTRWVLLGGGTEMEKKDVLVRSVEESGGEGRRGTKETPEESGLERDRWPGEQSTENIAEEALEGIGQAVRQTRTSNLELPAHPRSETLSLVADIAYPSTPELPNEMINNWPTLSSQGKRTRTNLLKAMVSESDQGDLGLGSPGRYPAILAMYRSVLYRGGLHRYDSERDTMAFGKPTEASLRPAWNILSSAAASRPKRRVPLKELHVLLLSPPIGMRKAAVAVFLTAWMLAAENRLRIFEGENEVSLNAESVLRMAERPEQFSIEIEVGNRLETTP